MIIMARKSKHFQLSEKNYAYLEELKEERQLKYLSDALDLVINEHRCKGDITTDYIIKLIVDKVSERIEEKFRGIKTASNSSDRNTKILLEMINGMFFKAKYGEIVTIAEDKSPALIIAENSVQKSIEGSRIKKLDSNFK
uniref:Uncharacterized protein n=2 Tax=Clostridium botulinum TaxID=1491 RepID=A0A0A0UUJ5_CLOBO|nr:hypothetical protein [Clostridium botulinum]AIW54553.1 hypothetical protein [Clostridium botulinum]ALP68998.1 hypothetical protein [Clostridium botulinum]